MSKEITTKYGNTQWTAYNRNRIGMFANTNCLGDNTVGLMVNNVRYGVSAAFDRDKTENKFVLDTPYLTIERADFSGKHTSQSAREKIKKIITEIANNVFTEADLLLAECDAVDSEIEEQTKRIMSKKLDLEEAEMKLMILVDKSARVTNEYKTAIKGESDANN